MFKLAAIDVLRGPVQVRNRVSNGPGQADANQQCNQNYKRKDDGNHQKNCSHHTSPHAHGGCEVRVDGGKPGGTSKKLIKSRIVGAIDPVAGLNQASKIELPVERETLCAYRTGRDELRGVAVLCLGRFCFGSFCSGNLFAGAWICGRRLCRISFDVNGSDFYALYRGLFMNIDSFGVDSQRAKICRDPGQKLLIEW